MDGVLTKKISKVLKENMWKIPENFYFIREKKVSAAGLMLLTTTVVIEFTTSGEIK